MNSFIGVSLVLVMAFSVTVKGQLVHRQVRLNNQGYTNTNAGVVEVYHNGEWGTVCASQLWNIDAAAVACRQAGFAAAKRNANPADYFDRSSYPNQKIWLENVYCTGYEETLVDCVEDPSEASCTHQADVAVVCADKKKEVDFTDDLKSRAAQLLLELLQEAKK